MPYQWSDKSKQRMIGVDQLLVLCATMALSRSKYDMTIPKYGGCRTDDEQFSLFVNKLTKCDGKDKKSKHQNGKALDVFPVTRNEKEKAYRHFAQNMFDVWAFICDNNLNARKYNLHWGGLWENFIDMPHWELKEIKEK